MKNRAVIEDHYFIKYVCADSIILNVHEDTLCALLLPTNTTAAELFKSLNHYTSGKLNWSFCVSLCTNRAAAITEWLSGFTTWVKKIASECESTHCVIHTEMLASQRMSPELSNILQIWLKLLTTLKYMPLTYICLCSSIRRWIYRTHTSSLEMAFQRQITGQGFLITRAIPEISFRKTVTTGSTFQWHRMGCKTCYLCDIFSLLSELNLSHQGEWQLCSSWQIKWLH